MHWQEEQEVGAQFAWSGGRTMRVFSLFVLPPERGAGHARRALQAANDAALAMVALAAMLGHAAMMPFKVKLGASRSIALPTRRLPCGKLRAPSTAG
jgi:GNAT superfamily N-acetyltransferase